MSGRRSKRSSATGSASEDDKSVKKSFHSHSSSDKGKGSRESESEHSGSGSERGSGSKSVGERESHTTPSDSRSPKASLTIEKPVDKNLKAVRGKPSNMPRLGLSRESSGLLADLRGVDEDNLDGFDLSAFESAVDPKVLSEALEASVAGTPKAKKRNRAFDHFRPESPATFNRRAMLEEHFGKREELILSNPVSPRDSEGEGEHEHHHHHHHHHGHGHSHSHKRGHTHPRSRPHSRTHSRANSRANSAANSPRGSDVSGSTPAVSTRAGPSLKYEPPELSDSSYSVSYSDEKPPPLILWLLAVIVESTTFQTITFIATIYALFVDEIVIIAFTAKVDIVFNIITFAIFLIFLFELVAVSIVNPSYRWSFYFFLDLLAMLSFLPGVVALFGGNIYGRSSGGSADNLALARAGRSARAAARAGRFVRVVKLFNLLKKRREEDDEESSESELEGDIKPSTVGATLIHRTTRTVIIGVLLMMVVFTAFDPSEVDRKYEYGVNRLELLSGGNVSDVYVKEVKNFLKEYPETIYIDILGEEFEGDAFKHRDELRETEIFEVVSLTDKSDGLFSIRADVRAAAGFDLGLTVFVIVILATGNFFIVRDADTLVIEPIEKMTTVVSQLANNPLINLRTQSGDDQRNGESETGMLLFVLKKIGGLLQIAFGEAGASIIAHNLGTGELNAMVPGTKVDAIFGFCDIRNFDTTTELLQEYVMLYVNAVADIVHNAVFEYGGYPNKNIGDAFLSVWKLGVSEEETKLPQPPSHRTEDGKETKLAPLPGTPTATSLERKASQNQLNRRASRGELTPTQTKAVEKKSEERRSSLASDRGGRRGSRTESLHKRTSSVSSTGTQGESNVYDGAVLAFIGVLRELQTNEDLKNITECMKQLSGDPNADMSVDMGFGLHVGWAIEGAIGSSYKVDASYLSPNVNMAARLEAATKQFGVAILISGQMYDNCSTEIQKRCRLLDRVTVKGSKFPLMLYTPDDYDVLSRARYNKAVRAYIDGDWTVAISLLVQHLGEYPDDKPGKVLLSYMDGFGRNAPPEWPGYRALDKK